MKYLNEASFFFRSFAIGHGSILIRMAIIYVIIRLFFVDNFNLKDELLTVSTYLLIFLGLYAVTIALDTKRLESSPLFLSGFIDKRIREDYILSNVLTSKDERGVYVTNMTVVGHNVNTTFNLHNDPKLIHERATAFLYILESMQLPEHERTILRLRRLKEESAHMMKED